MATNDTINIAANFCDEDGRLMACAAKGDDTAFEELVDRCQDGVIQYFKMLCRDSHIAEDLAQEAFIKLYTSRNRYRRTAKFKTFFYRIAYHTWVDYGRRHRATLVSLTEVSELTAPQVKEPLFEQDTLLSAEILDAVVRLPEKQKQVLLLHLLDDFTHADIAKTLSIPRGTVKSRMHHALQSLRSTLKTDEHHET